MRTAFWVLLVAAAGAAANDSIPRTDRGVYRAVRTPGAIAVDGDLSEPAWQAAPEISGFIQRDPDEGKPASERTRVRVLYDEEALYIGAVLEDRHPVTTQLGRRDTELESDWFWVYLDPHYDRRSGVGFGVNPANVQFDLVLYNDNWDDSDWDAVWSSATKIHEGGWSVEMRLPYSQLRFPAREKHTWGINFGRRIARNNESARLVHVPKTDSGFVSRFADLEGIEGVHPKRALEILPYLVTRVDHRATIAPDDPFRSATELDATAGLDVKYGLTSNLTLTGTVNPDFGQVEVDPAQVNLSQFELFYPEKRPFFIEGNSLFEFGRGGSNNNFNINNFPPILFYSRRIGRTPQGVGELDYDHVEAPGESTILAAAKITGKTAGGWTIAALDAFTEKEEARFSLDGLTRRATIEPATNYLVARTAKDLGTRGRVGALVTAVNRSLDDDVSWMRDEAYLAGVDGHWFFRDRDWLLEWFVAGTVVRGSAEAIERTQTSPGHQYQRPDAGHVELDPSRTSLEGWGTRVALAKQKGKWRTNLQVQGYSPGFETNDAGYMQRADYVATHAVVLYRDPEPRGRIRQRGFWIAKWQNWNFDGDLTSNGIGGNGYLIWRNYWETWLDVFHGFPRLDDRATRGGPLIRNPGGTFVSTGVATDRRKKVSFDLGVSIDESGEGSWERGIYGGVQIRPTPALNLRISPEYSWSDYFAQYVGTFADPLATATYGNRYVFARIAQKSLQLSTRLEWTFNSRLSFQMYLQPYVAAGDYYGFKEVARPRSTEFRTYGADGSRISYDPESDRWEADPDGSGPAAPFRFDDPDFNFRSVRGSAVVRWEFRPGSAVYFVWNENRADLIGTGRFSARRDLGALPDVPADDVFLVKMSYWIGQ